MYPQRHGPYYATQVMPLHHCEPYYVAQIMSTHYYESYYER